MRGSTTGYTRPLQETLMNHSVQWNVYNKPNLVETHDALQYFLVKRGCENWWKWRWVRFHPIPDPFFFKRWIHIFFPYNKSLNIFPPFFLLYLRVVCTNHPFGTLHCPPKKHPNCHANDTHVPPRWFEARGVIEQQRQKIHTLEVWPWISWVFS